MIGREDDQKMLSNLFGSGDPLTSCVVINGPSGCGKSLLVSTTLSELEQRCGSKWILLSCLDVCYSSSQSTNSPISSRLLFELILQSIKTRYGLDVSETICRCDCAATFFDGLCTLIRFIIRSSSRFPTSLMMVFDQAEKLRDADPLLLPLIVRLGSLVENQMERESSDHPDFRMVTVLITRSPWEKFTSGTFHMEPVICALSNYTREQAMRILLSLKPSNAPQERFSRFLDLLLTVCFPVCRNAGELIHLMQINWPAFEEPVLKGLVASDDEWGQWKLAQPTLKRSISTLYLRQSNDMLCTSGGSRISVASVELPYFSRFLAVASFLASYNSKLSDRKFFLKNTGKQTNRTKRKEKMAGKTSTLLQGPRLFPLDRLLAIFHAIIRDESENVPNTMLLVSQVSCLTALGLIAAASPANAFGGSHSSGVISGLSSAVRDVDPLSNPKYRCLLTFEMAKTIAQSVDFDLPAYLTDFCGVC